VSAVRRREGIVLVMVLFFVLLLTSAIATFLRRAAMDAGVASHRDRARQAEALARGGVRLGETLLLEDLRLQGAQAAPDSQESVWARVRGVDLDDDPDVELRLEIQDAAAFVNLNGLLVKGEVDEKARGFLEDFLAGVIAVMPGDPKDRSYDAAELAARLADWIDADEVGSDGAPEDEAYAKRDPPVRPWNQPLLSVDELRQIEGFDGPLVDALRPFVTVFPLVGGGGVNLNTAPPWVLAQILRGSSVSGFRRLEEEDVRRIVEAREEGPICGRDAQAPGCRPLADLFQGEELQPPPTGRSSVFTIRATATVVDVERTVEAVVDRRDPSNLVRLAWRVD
jgi:general secretion pathway protein K